MTRNNIVRMIGTELRFTVGEENEKNFFLYFPRTISKSYHDMVVVHNTHSREYNRAASRDNIIGLNL